MKSYSTLALPGLLYGSENWTIKAEDKARLMSAEMKFMRRTADGYIWSDLKEITEILEELKVTPMQDQISNYKTDWRDRVNRMSRSRLAKLIRQYIPKGRRDQGRPMKKMTDGFRGRNRLTLAYILDKYMIMMKAFKLQNTHRQ
jgi:hypothetical protein